MSAVARTNQLLYQAELLLALPAGDDEHAPARRMALEEGALGQLGLAFEALLREVTTHAPGGAPDWRTWLDAAGQPQAGGDAAARGEIAELVWLETLAARPESWLALLLARLVALQSDEGAARRGGSPGLITRAGATPLGDELCWCLEEFKALLPSLRQGSQEW
ncbi:DUF6586 family protein [Salinicola endophyticus]|uniref:DUF6586 family protein n=1 Tax=Salinicola endophyticus TaxID=1949083 RepID=UPI000DA16E72|nr:DUF6586 family protein [Salinicola endophyticus]